MRLPYFIKRIGTGTSTSPTRPSKRPAQLVPIPWNIKVAKRGKTAPNEDLKKVLPAKAEAAKKRYESTM